MNRRSFLGRVLAFLGLAAAVPLAKALPLVRDLPPQTLDDLVSRVESLWPNVEGVNRIHSVPILFVFRAKGHEGWDEKLIVAMWNAFRATAEREPRGTLRWRRKPQLVHGYLDYDGEFTELPFSATTEPITQVSCRATVW
jgi:hypothetical protein